MIKKIASVFCLCALLQACSKPAVKVAEQGLIYDSINYKGSVFNVNLYTTLEFSADEIARKEYNDFLLIINKDTLPLVPEINNMKVKGKDGKIDIQYLSHLNFKSRTYDNDSLAKIIKTSKIVNSESKSISSKEAIPLQTYIALRKKTDSKIRLE